MNLIKYSDISNLITKLNREKYGRKNKQLMLYLELVYNHKLLSSYSSTDEEKLPKIPILESDINEIIEASEKDLTVVVLQAILLQLKSEAYEYWISSSYNLNSFGWINSRSKEKILFWIFLSRIMNKIAILSTRLSIESDNPELKPNLVNVNAHLHLIRLKGDLEKAIIHLHYHQKYSWIRRLSMLVLKRPILKDVKSK